MLNLHYKSARFLEVGIMETGLRNETYLTVKVKHILT